MTFKNMREYTHEEFVELILKLSEKQLLELSSKCGGIQFYLEWLLMKE